MQVCRACGKQNRADAHFCQGCGADLSAQVCVGCGQLNSPQARACLRCGKVLVQLCPQCQRANQPQARFCQFCGGGLGHCPHCGARKRPGARFCPQCGRDPTNLRAHSVAPTVLHQRYKIHHLIAKGGMGAVYQVSDLQKPAQLWALKEMSLDNVEAHEQQAAIADFRREALLLRTLAHPNLVKVIDNFSESSKEYLVMEYVRGEMLDAFLQNQPRTEATVLPLALQLCNVLEYLHAQKPPIIYRDLKPGNAMIETATGVVKLIDFGIARFYKPGQQKDTKLLGTPGFAPPEQYGKGQTDARSDIFTLGVTLHVLLTEYDVEQNPWNYPPVSTLNPQVSQQMEQVISKATEMASDQRYQTMAEMRQALLQCPGGKVLAGRLPPVASKTVAKPATAVATVKPPTLVAVAPPLALPQAKPAVFAFSTQALNFKMAQNSSVQKQLTIKSNLRSANQPARVTTPTWLTVTPQQFTSAEATLHVCAQPAQITLPRARRPMPPWVAKAWAWAESKGACRHPWGNAQALQRTVQFGLPALLAGSLAYALTWAVYQHAYFFVPGALVVQGHLEVSYQGGAQTLPVTLTVEPARPRMFLGWSAAVLAVICEVLGALWLLA